MTSQMKFLHLRSILHLLFVKTIAEFRKISGIVTNSYINRGFSHILNYTWVTQIKVCDILKVGEVYFGVVVDNNINCKYTKHYSINVCDLMRKASKNILTHQNVFLLT